VNECVDVLANRLYRGGKIKDKCKKAGFYERLTLLEKQFKGAAVLLHKMGLLPVGFRELWANDRLLNVVEQLIGPDIAGELKPLTSYTSTKSTRKGRCYLAALITMVILWVKTPTPCHIVAARWFGWFTTRRLVEA